MANQKAIMRYHEDRIAVLCPNGHYVTQIVLDGNTGGSTASAELSARTAGRDNVYDRLAASCAEQDRLESQQK